MAPRRTCHRATSLVPARRHTWQVALDSINSASRSFLVTPYVICT
jgi:hypothetical protein